MKLAPKHSRNSVRGVSPSAPRFMEKEPIPQSEQENRPEKIEAEDFEVEKKDSALESVGEDEEREKKIAEALGRIKQTKSSETQQEIDHQLLGDFSDAEIENGRIIISSEEQEGVKEQLKRIKARDNFRLPSLIKGIRTATEYDSRVTNFSTKTSIIETKDGRKIFAVDCYPSSQIHRWLDGLAKRLVGHRFVKAPSSRWKSVFKRRSRIPVIENDDPRVVLMPYLDNVNLRDLLADNEEIKDFGQCDWAQDIDIETKRKIIDQIVDQVAELHAEGGSWGETILHNMIITKDKRVVICDPETEYDDDVPQVERMASDLRDITFSTSSALSKSEGIQDPQEVVDQILSRYGNQEVIDELKRLVGKKPGLLQKIVMPFYETVRIGVKDMKEYERVRQAILKYQSPE